MLDIRSLHAIPIEAPYVGSNFIQGAVIGVLISLPLWVLVIGGLIWLLS